MDLVIHGLAGCAGSGADPMSGMIDLAFRGMNESGRCVVVSGADTIVCGVDIRNCYRDYIPGPRQNCIDGRGFHLVNAILWLEKSGRPRYPRLELGTDL